jgi:hypothetical protein
MTTYKKYLFVLDDKYNLSSLKKYIGKANDLEHISKDAYIKTKSILEANVNGITLNDKFNTTVALQGKKSSMSLTNPVSLFAPYRLIYDPDIYQTGPIGWPIQDEKIQNLGFQTVNEGKPSCIVYKQDGLVRQSPYTSHCSSYIAWICQIVFSISLVPTQIGDWCHAASEQRDIMYNLKDWWEKIDSVSAQKLANQGKLVIVAKKLDDPEREGYKQNGHIAIVLPCTVGLAEKLQKKSNYPTNPVVSNEKTFEQFIKLYGPEITQSGGLNFSHTITANGFANYYAPNQKVGITPIDEVVEFFVYKLYTQTIG